MGLHRCQDYEVQFNELKWEDGSIKMEITVFWFKFLQKKDTSLMLSFQSEGGKNERPLKVYLKVFQACQLTLQKC